jgi:hypothetical protein
MRRIGSGVAVPTPGFGFPVFKAAHSPGVVINTGGSFSGIAPAPGAEVFDSFSQVRQSGSGASSLPGSGSFGRE